MRGFKVAIFTTGVIAGVGFLAIGLAAGADADKPSQQPTAASVAAAPAAEVIGNQGPAERERLLTQYCSGCHNDKLKTAGMSVQVLKADNLPANLGTWEKILRRVSLGEMPPKGMRRPSKEQIADFAHWLSTSLDENGARNPNPGRISARRLNRTQYSNAIRDLLDLDIDISKELPVDDTGYGFDNIGDILTISPTLIDRYMTVASKVSRLATGQASRQSVVVDHKIEKDTQVLGFGIPSYNLRTNDELPLGSRGGGTFRFYAPYDATYTIQLYLNPGTVTERETNAANRLEVEVPLKAGLRVIGASFPKQLALDEELLPKKSVGARPGKAKGAPVPLSLIVQVDGAPVKAFTVPSFATGPEVVQGFFLRDVVQISVAGPRNITGSGDTPSRRKIFFCQPSSPSTETSCARKILTSIAHKAFRRPVTSSDMSPLMKIYEDARKRSGFEQGIEASLEAILVSPDFLLIRESEPADSKSAAVRRLNDLELATRLSLFLWSSIPDEELLAVAEKRTLRRPAVMRAQIDRMLQDKRGLALTQNFAGQWLYLRKLEVQRPDHDTFPDFSQPLRTAMKTETEMFFTGILRENRSVLDFLNADYTYLNQPLAEHYGIKGVYGTTFRKVKLDPALNRGGLLGQASILTVTSYNNRTSIVLRGKWILENILGAPPPPPPPDVPDLKEAKNGTMLTVREQMDMHRSNAVCASCHNKMDPLGFALENFDAVGTWRGEDAGKKLDVSAVLPDGTKFDGPLGLQSILMARKEQFVDTFTEMMMIYALGRGVEAYDMPAVREIRRNAEKNDYRMQDIIMGIVQSVPFSMKKPSNI